MQTDHAADYANLLLGALGVSERVAKKSDHPAIAWKRSGLLETTKLMLPLPLAAHADGALMALKALCPESDLPKSAAQILGERARLRKSIRQGRLCAGGYGRLLDTQTSHIGLNLVREDDWDLIPAWLEDDVSDWDGIVKIVKGRKASSLVRRAAELGLAVAEDSFIARSKTWFSKTEFKKYAPKPRPKCKPIIVDMSSLWAGPLASSLLGMTGAEIIKIESPARPDGMRFGHKGFYDVLNAGKACVALDFRDPTDLAQLKALLSKADIVIEASRPRALEQLGIVAEDYVAENSGKVWARLTAYGRGQNRIGFGDDIGIAAGLASVMDAAHGEPCFVGDAIADPVNGLHLALAIYAHYKAGGGVVLDFSMQEVLRFAMGDITDNLDKTARDWTKIAALNAKALYPMRHLIGETHEVGAHNGKWLC